MLPPPGMADLTTFVIVTGRGCFHLLSSFDFWVSLCGGDLHTGPLWRRWQEPGPPLRMHKEAPSYLKVGLIMQAPRLSISLSQKDRWLLLRASSLQTDYLFNLIHQCLLFLCLILVLMSQPRHPSSLTASQGLDKLGTQSRVLSPGSEWAGCSVLGLGELGAQSWVWVGRVLSPGSG